MKAAFGAANARPYHGSRERARHTGKPAGVNEASANGTFTRFSECRPASCSVLRSLKMSPPMMFAQVGEQKSANSASLHVCCGLCSYRARDAVSRPHIVPIACAHCRRSAVAQLSQRVFRRISASSHSVSRFIATHRLQLTWLISLLFCHHFGRSPFALH